MNNLYKKIGIVFGILLMMSCSKDMMKEGPSFIPENPNPGGEQLPPNEQWAWVGKYPGEISNSYQRLTDIEVKISGNYQPKALHMATNLKYWQSSGLYAPPAEQVIVEVPAGVGNLNYQIGIADVTLPSGVKYERYEKVSKSGALAPGENRISSNFGGPLYFYFDGAPTTSEVTLKITGAVKSTDYIMGETDKTEWLKAVADTVNTPMIWGELIGKRVIFTLPLSAMKKIQDPDFFLKFYDDLIELDFDVLAGLNSTDLQMPWRIYSDVQLPNDENGTASKVYPAYPMGYNSITADSLEDSFLRLPFFEGKSGAEVLKGFAGLYGMTWGTSKLLKNQIQQISSYHFYQRRGRWSSLDITMNSPKDPTLRYWMAREADRYTMVLQLLQQYGWGLFTYCSQRSQEEIPESVPDRYKNDLFAIYASEFANADLSEFFAAWDFQLSMYAQSYMKNYSPVADKFWTTNDPSKQPEYTEPNPAGASYPKEIPANDTIYDRSQWTAAAKTEINDGGGNGYITCIIDGKVDTYYHSNWANTEGTTYPHWMSFQFEEEEEFNYVYFVNRIHANPGAKTFVIQIKPTPGEDDDWVEIEDGKEFYLTRDYASGQDNYQYRFLSKAYKGYGIKIIFTESLPRTEGGTDVVGYVAMAEFGTGLLK